MTSGAITDKARSRAGGAVGQADCTARSMPAAGSWAVSVARARSRALFTDTSLTPGMPAACAAG